MENRSIYKNISPIDHRYYKSNKKLFDELSKYISEEAGISYCISVESALIKAHMENSKIAKRDFIKIIDELNTKITPDEIYEEEEKTQHNIRALVNVIKRYLPSEIRHFVHLGATSVDILDTATALRMRDVTRKVILPLMMDVEDLLIELAENERGTPQVGRTHGQHAVPITFGFAIAEYVSRFGKTISKIEELSQNLRGKLAGAVGSYNSTAMISRDPEEFEKSFLSFLGLKPSEHSTQMVEPEYLLRLLLEMNVSFGILANLADDLRHLQRSEISEIREFFSEDQVGSSTMPQKRNPWNSEHVKSLWKAFSPRVVTFFMDQISEHQRDLSNSASARFTGDYIAGFAAALNRQKKILKGLFIDRDSMKKNIVKNGDFVLAEAVYILLSISGNSDAHEVVRKMTIECEKGKKPLLDFLKGEEKIWNTIKHQLEVTSGIDAELFFSNPELYRGISIKKAGDIAKQYKKNNELIRSKI